MSRTGEKKTKKGTGKEGNRNRLKTHRAPPTTHLPNLLPSALFPTSRNPLLSTLRSPSTTPPCARILPSMSALIVLPGGAACRLLTSSANSRTAAAEDARAVFRSGVGAGVVSRGVWGADWLAGWYATGAGAGWVYSYGMGADWLAYGVVVDWLA